MSRTYLKLKGGFTVRLWDHSLLAKHSMIAVLFIVSFIAIGDQAQAANSSFGDSTGKNEACIACHGNQAKVNSKNYIDPLRFGHTTHANFGCTTCHDKITSSHPDGKPTAFTTSCDNCHGDIITQYST